MCIDSGLPLFALVWNIIWYVARRISKSTILSVCTLDSYVKKDKCLRQPELSTVGKICMKPIIYKSTPEQSGFDHLSQNVCFIVVKLLDPLHRLHWQFWRRWEETLYISGYCQCLGTAWRVLCFLLLIFFACPACLHLVLLSVLWWVFFGNHRSRNGSWLDCLWSVCNVLLCYRLGLSCSLLGLSCCVAWVVLFIALGVHSGFWSVVGFPCCACVYTACVALTWLLPLFHLRCAADRTWDWESS